jgi:glycosyltransferase involved in cell wall biosynthesis
MKILLINHYAGAPKYGMVFRPYYLAYEWVRRGHKVTVVGASYSHLRYKNPNVVGRYLTEWIDGIKYIWLKTTPYRGNGWGRLANIFTFLIRLLTQLTVVCRESKPDVVIASPTYQVDIIISYIISRIYRAKLIFEVRDLWPLVPLEMGKYSSYHPFIWIIGLAERFGYRKADKVVSVAPYAHEYMFKRGLPLDRYVHIPNGISTISSAEASVGLRPIHSPASLYLSGLKKMGYFIIGYVGSIRKAYALEYFINCAKEFKGQKVMFVLVGQGDERKELEQIASGKKITNVAFFNSIPKANIQELLSYIDICYTGFKKLSCFSYGVSSNKLYEYMLAAKPIVLAVDTPYPSIVDQALCGITIEAENVTALKEAILTMLDKDTGEFMEMGKRGYQYVMKNHNYSTLSEKYLELMTEI